MVQDLRELEEQLGTVQAETTEIQPALMGVSLLSFLNMFNSSHPSFIY